MSDLLVVDERAARCQDLAAEAVGGQRRSTVAWVNLGRELIAEREARPAKQDFGRWLKQYNTFGVPIDMIGRSIAAARYVESLDSDSTEWQDTGVQRLARLWRDEEARRRRELLPPPADAPTIDLRLGDFREVLADLQDVDAIITDPPYPQQYLPLLDDLAAWADKVLKPDGVLAVLMGQTHLPEVYRRLDGHRPYRWTACYLTPGAGYASMARRVQCKWKPLIMYGGGPRFDDLITSSNANSRHEWGQDYDAFDTIVRRLTLPGSLIVDPMAGHGTTLWAARNNGRHAIGAEINPEHHAEAVRHLG